MTWPEVTADDIAGRWRPLTTAEAAVAEARIEDAGAQLRTALRLRGIHQPPSFATEEESADWARRYISTIADAVARFLKNTDGWAEEREQIDDWSLTRRRARESEEGVLFISDSEADALVPLVKRRTRAFTIRLGLS